MIGYAILERVDRWRERKARVKAIERVFDDEIFDWEDDPEDPTHEKKDGMTRVRLEGPEQIVVARIVSLLHRLYLVWGQA